MTGWRAPHGRVIVSGGQSGIDRVALDVAAELGLGRGGWCPRARGAEDGRVPDRYPVWELDDADPAARTRANVELADATLVLASAGARSPGTDLTREHAARVDRPLLACTERTSPAEVRGWLARHDVHVLDVAGPRRSEDPDAPAWAGDLLRSTLDPAEGEGRRWALWAIPERRARRILQEHVDTLEGRAGLPPFVPHGTVDVLPPAAAEAVLERIPLLAAPPAARIVGVEHVPDDPRRVLTLRLEPEADGLAWTEEPPPHLSLSYGVGDEGAARGVAEALGDRLVFDQLWAVAVGDSARPAPARWHLRTMRPLTHPASSSTSRGTA